MKKGFTLIELLVVISIIAILAAILFPVFARAKDAAKAAGDTSNLKQLAVAAEMYRADNDGFYFPLYYSDPSRVSTPSNSGLWRWPWLIKDYTRNFEVFFSPLDEQGKAFFSGNAATPSWGYLFGLSPSWGYNQQAFCPQNLTSGLFEPRSESRIGEPSATLLLASSMWYTSDSLPKTGYYRVYPPDEWAGSPPLTGLSYGHVWPRLPGNRANVLFADGHVKGIAIEALRREEWWGLLGND